MCDTLCSLSSNNSSSAITYFAKNSDRDPNEMQVVEYHGREERKGKTRATYIDVEFTGDTYPVIISRPFWMWGAEMGINDHGVAAGNEAIFTRTSGHEKALLGMDLLRLGLEKGGTARSATDTVIEYLEKYGQGGSNSTFRKTYYDNSMIITDRKEAFALQAIGKEWELRKVSGFCSISNAIEGGDDVVASSGNFVTPRDTVYTRLGKGRARREQTLASLSSGKNSTSIGTIFMTMRSHNSDDFHPAGGSNADVCMHAAPFTRINQTVNSFAAEIGDRFSIAWFTFSSNPCMSTYKPVIFIHGEVPELPYNGSYWLSAEIRNRKISTGDSKAYRKAAAGARAAQDTILERVTPVRDKLIEGAIPVQEEIRSLQESVRQIDDNYLSHNADSPGREKAFSRLFYRRWQMKIDREMPAFNLS